MSSRKIRHLDHGPVYAADQEGRRTRVCANEIGSYNSLGCIEQQVRRRTSDDRWLRIEQVLSSTDAVPTMGPVGAGVDFFLDADPEGLLAEPGIRLRIEQAAYEAAREVIVAEVDEHVLRMRAVCAAIEQFAAASPRSSGGKRRPR